MRYPNKRISLGTNPTGIFNYSIFGPKFTFTGNMVEAEITIH